MPFHALTAAKMRILDAAWSLVLERRNADFTTTELAEICKISRQAVYFHFPNRPLLLDAMLSRFFESHPRAKPESQGDVTASKEFEKSLRRCLNDLRRVWPVAYGLQLARTPDPEAEAWTDWREEWEERDWLGVWLGSLYKIVKRLQEHGGLTHGWSLDDAAAWIWARTQPSVWHYLVNECGWPNGRVAKRLVPSIMAELVAPEASKVMILDPTRCRRRPAPQGANQAS